MESHTPWVLRHRLSLWMLSKAFSKSTLIYNCLCHSVHWPGMLRRVKIWSMQPHPFWKPACSCAIIVICAYLTRNVISYNFSAQVCLWGCGARIENVCMWHRRMCVVRARMWHLLALVCRRKTRMTCAHTKMFITLMQSYVAPTYSYKTNAFVHNCILQYVCMYWYVTRMYACGVLVTISF